MGAVAMMSVPFNEYHEMKHNSAGQNQLNFGIRMQNKVSHSSIKIFLFNLTFSVPGPVKSLKEPWDRQSLIENQKFAVANYTSSWTLNVQSFT